jgi:outer membrane protein OmpA-like peptidoglycan-associated protein
MFGIRQCGVQLVRNLSWALILLTLGLSSPSFALSPTWQGARDLPPGDVFKIAQYIETSGSDSLVLVSAGRGVGISVGTLFKVYRAAPVDQESISHSATSDALWVEMGQLKVVEVQDRYAVARVEKQGSEIVQALFPKFPEIMAGDFAVIQRVNIARRPLVIPNVAVTYAEIFTDPNGRPGTFELKSQGTERLKELAKPFANARLSMLMVEGYTDQEGSASANQVESYQRALTVRQFLIDELGFDESRVVAVGYGEAQPADTSFAPGSVEANRRIVLKAITIQNKKIN